MDTSREHVLLNELWNHGDAPWAVWNRRPAAASSSPTGPVLSTGVPAPRTPPAERAPLTAR